MEKPFPFNPPVCPRAWVPFPPQPDSFSSFFSFFFFFFLLLRSMSHAPVPALGFTCARPTLAFAGGGVRAGPTLAPTPLATARRFHTSRPHAVLPPAGAACMSFVCRHAPPPREAPAPTASAPNSPPARGRPPWPRRPSPVPGCYLRLTHISSQFKFIYSSERLAPFGLGFWRMSK